MSETIFKALAAPFAPHQVKWRVGSTNADKTKGLALAYVDARDVMDRLDEVVGAAGWQNNTQLLAGDQRVLCTIGIKCGDEWLWKSDGAGATDVEGEKGGISDAFKRAAVHWGIGRYLYHMKSPWVALVARGRSYSIDPREMPTLEALARGNQPATHDPGPTPSNWDDASPAPSRAAEVERTMAEAGLGPQKVETRPDDPFADQREAAPPSGEGEIPEGERISQKQVGLILARSRAKAEEHNADYLAVLNYALLEARRPTVPFGSDKDATFTHVHHNVTWKGHPKQIDVVLEAIKGWRPVTAEEF